MKKNRLCLYLSFMHLRQTSDSQVGFCQNHGRTTDKLAINWQGVDQVELRIPLLDFV